VISLLLAGACTSDFAYDQWPSNQGGGTAGALVGESGDGGAGPDDRAGRGGEPPGSKGGTGGKGGTAGNTSPHAGRAGGGEAGGNVVAGEGGAAGDSLGGEGPGGAGTGGAPPSILAAVPPMGWNSWNRFGGSVSEGVVRSTMDAMVSKGLRDVGYEYVNIDDTWQASSRDAEGKLRADPVRFPNGIEALADYAHERGLKLGIYSDRGTQTCSGRPGSYGSEELDAATFAEWGVDYLKYDNCHVPPGREGDEAMREDYTKMRDALVASGRPVVFSICAWWFSPWMPDVGQLWRTTGDIKDTWADVLAIVDRNGGDTSRYADASYGPPGLAPYASPGHFNDPDMLEVGNGGMTDAEYRSHFSLWAIMAAPLIAGNDVRIMDSATADILMNEDVIRVDQDPLGKQGRPISASTTLEVWAKQLAGDKTHAVVLFNRTASSADITVDFAELGFAAATARDLWSHEELGRLEGSYTATVPTHGVVMLRVVGE